jgi:hypothetical protein
MAYRNGRLAGALILIALGASTAATARPPADSLYARLGGTPVVSAFVADTIDKVVADPRSNQLAKEQLTQRICMLTGGGCISRQDAPGTQRADDRLVEALRESMRARDVPLAARNQLLEILLKP